MTLFAKAHHPDSLRPPVVLAIKSVLLVAIVVTLQLISARLGYNPQGTPDGGDNEYEITIRQCDEIVRLNPEILYFGDSTVYPMSIDSDDRRSTPTMLADLMPKRHVKGFYGVGLTPVFFDESLAYFARKGCRPDMVILPINVRAFSDAWRADPMLQFPEIRSFLKHDSIWFRAFYRPLRTLGALDVKRGSNSEYFFTVHEHLRGSPAYEAFELSNTGEGKLNRVRDFAYYGVPITDTDPTLTALLNIRDTTSRMQAQLYCYITPVDFSNIERLLGREVANIARENTVFLDLWMRERGFNVLNLTDALSPELTHAVGVTSSHLNAKGRQQVANRLRQFITESDVTSVD